MYFFFKKFPLIFLTQVFPLHSLVLHLLLLVAIPLTFTMASDDNNNNDKNNNDKNEKKKLKLFHFDNFHFSFTKKTGPSNILIYKIYFLLPSRINLLLLTEKVGLL